MCRPQFDWEEERGSEVSSFFCPALSLAILAQVEEEEVEEVEALVKVLGLLEVVVVVEVVESVEVGRWRRVHPPLLLLL